MGGGGDHLGGFGPLAPRLHRGRYVFVTLPDLDAAARLGAVATVREPEGISAVVESERAKEAGLPGTPEFAWIIFEAQTELDLVGLTAAVATRLTDAGIPCNVVAGAHHDHLFVPAERAEEAMGLLGGAG